jgi:hypothetical protein
VFKNESAVCLSIKKILVAGEKSSKFENMLKDNFQKLLKITFETQMNDMFGFFGLYTLDFKV